MIDKQTITDNAGTILIAMGLIALFGSIWEPRVLPLLVIGICGLVLLAGLVSLFRKKAKPTAEIERKFLVNKGQVPLQMGKQVVVRINQGWLVSANNCSVRIRQSLGQSEASHVMAVKSGSGLSRLETEMDIPAEQFHALWGQVKSSLEKVRTLIPLPGGHTAEYDVFSGVLSGLELVEVEFASEKDALAFVPPAWFGPEVTEDSRYVNAVLAESGIIPAEESDNSLYEKRRI